MLTDIQKWARVVALLAMLGVLVVVGQDIFGRVQDAARNAL